MIFNEIVSKIASIETRHWPLDSFALDELVALDDTRRNLPIKQMSLGTFVIPIGICQIIYFFLFNLRWSFQWTFTFKSFDNINLDTAHKKYDRQ